MIRIKTKSIASLLLCSLAFAANAQNDADAIPIDKNTKVGKLANGLTYYIRRNVKPEGKVELKLAVNAGSVLERDDQQGVAHFLEHMAFNGTKNFPKNELVEFLQKAGVRFGADLNAHTSFDETVYDLPISSKDEKVLNKGYQVIRDWAGNLLLETSEIDKERGIILEEKRMRQGAGMRMMTKYFPSLLNGSKYGERLPIGTEHIITTAPRKAFVDFYNDWYRPNNMAVIIVGDIDVVQAEAKVKALFGDLKNPSKAPVRPEITPIQWHKEDKAAVVTDKENTSNIIQVYLGLKKAEDPTKWKSYGENTLNELLSSMLGNRLEEYGLKASSPIGFGRVSLEGSQFRGYSQINMLASVKENATDALNTIVLEVLNAKKFGFTTAEFERAKKETLENYVERAAEKDKTESSRFANEYVNNFLDKEASPGIEAEKKYVDQYFAKLTLAEANAAIAKLDINAPAYVLFTALESAKNLPTEASLLAAYKAAKLQTPKAYEEKAVAKELIDVMPAAGKVVNTESNADFGTKSYTLSNGIKVICKKTDYKNDEILLSGFQWGGNSNLTEREIVVSKYLRTVVNSLGLGTHNSSELQKMLTGVNAMATLSSSNNTLSVNGKSTVKDFEKFMQILHLRLTNVNFDSEEMDGMRSSSKQQIGMLKNNPSLKFVDTLNMFKYSNSKRFAYFPYLEEMATVSNDDIKNLYKKLTSNLNGLTLVLIGNVDDANIATMLEKYVGSITTKSEKISLNTANIIRPVIGKNTFLVKGGKEKKSEINHTYYGNITSFDDKENLSYGLLAEVLQMKTTEKLREEMGGTYSPRVGGQMTRPPMLEYSLSLIVPSAPENVDKLTAAFDEIVAKVAGGDISDDDMLKAKEQRKKALETQMKTNNYWLQIVESQDMYKFNTSLITTYFTRLNDITKADLVSVAKKYLTNANILKAVMNPE